MTIKEARQAAGVTQKMLADALGVSQQYVSKLERGEMSPANITAKNLLAIADILGVDPHELVNEA
ncbi:helix-turn-helix transcriptional regulator [uncultured Intestinimonas sp.]|uniref:helix-turn-helix domain-containing protein n=1 Tax=uncultured Intestinimonas sp. TaxID=1689265 RepID=UPI0025D3BD3D|nr:helix-turn-helix transcriptional regulator [uncultured Intestinimonas sp.]